MPKGAFDAIKSQGLERFRTRVAATVPALAGSVTALTDWDQVKLLEVQINRLTRWHAPGLLYIGDSAHAMSAASTTLNWRPIHLIRRDEQSPDA